MTSNGYIPLVSIIMPAYNIERYIEKAIRSVINQTFTDWELIVIDDGSKDSTLDIIELMVAEDERISSMPNETNIGVAKTRNRGIDIARGKYIALLDSDDIWYENKLELQIKKLEAEKADICYCSYAIIDEEGKKIRNDYMVSERVDFKDMLKENHIGCSTVILSRSALDNNRFLTDYYHEDYVLWLDLLKSGARAVGCSDVLAEWRLIRDSRSFDKKRSANFRWKIYRQHLGFSWFKSGYWFVCYALNGVRKYFKF